MLKNMNTILIYCDSAGTGGNSNPMQPADSITTADKAGAGIITAIILVSLLGGSW